MVDRVGSTPQVGGRNLNELVAKRDSQKTLVRSVSGPPATAVAPSSSKAPDVEPAIKAPDTGEQINKARERRRRLESSSVSVQQAAQGTNTSSQLRELTGQAIKNSTRSRPSPEQVRPEQAQGQAGVASVPQSAPDSGQDNVDIALGGSEAPEIAPVGVGGNAGQQPSPVGTESKNQPVSAVSEPEAAPTLDTNESRDPQAVVNTGPSPAVKDPEVALPNAPESSPDIKKDSPETPEARGDVVNVVA